MNEQVKPCSRFRRLNGTIDNQWGGCEASQIFSGRHSRYRWRNRA
nr:MAG TPA: hypothetical protein [Caudoviricetes sp.]